MRIVGHAGSSGLFEIKFDDKIFEILHCTRLHEVDDFLSARYVPGTNKILSGSVRGVAILSEGNLKLKEWKFFSTGAPSIHWFEHLDDETYLLACDGRKVIRLDISNDNNTIEGPYIVKDHMEHTTFCKKTARLYASSFDRTVVEVDLLTCEKIKTVWNAPFKLRWIKVLEKSPTIMIVQCRDGGLYKIDIESGKVISTIKYTQAALWSVDKLNDCIITSGEGDNVIKINVEYKNDSFERLPEFKLKYSKLPVDKYFFTKRLSVHQKSAAIAYGRSDGALLLECDNTVLTLAKFPEAIRDIAFDNNGENIFSACENGVVYKTNIRSTINSKISQSEGPVWALAYNHKKNLLAIGDRVRNIFILNLDSNTKTKIAENLGFVKRIRWQDENNLLYGSAGTLFRYNIQTERATALCHLENTVEDFDWDIQKRYIVIVDYTRYLYLCDFETGEMLYEHGDMIDYSKGIIFIDKLKGYAGYPGDFIVVGRAGYPILYRIHDDRIISYGFVRNLNGGGEL